MENNINASNNKIKRKRDPAKSKLIRAIFDIDDKAIEPKPKTKKVIIIRYDETIYFKKNDNSKDDIQNYISLLPPSNNAQINTPVNPFSQKEPSQNIQLNFNINNNYYQNQPQIRYHEDNHLTPPPKLRSANYNNKSVAMEKRTTSNAHSNLLPIMTSGTSPIANSASFSKGVFRKGSSKGDNSNMLMYIPCMNCGNSIPIEEVEQHSNVCTKVSEEVMKTESGNAEVYPINYKLNKLKEHLANVTEHKEKVVNKETCYISTVLLQYINDTLKCEKFDIDTIKELKKIIINIEILSVQNKSSMANMVLLDRTKLLVKEKKRIFIQMHKLQLKTIKKNEEKIGDLNYEHTIRERQKELERLKMETELQKNKVKNLRKSAKPSDKPKNLNLIIQDYTLDNPKEESKVEQSDNTNNNNINNNNIINNNTNNNDYSHNEIDFSLMPNCSLNNDNNNNNSINNNTNNNDYLQNEIDASLMANYSLNNDVYVQDNKLDEIMSNIDNARLDISLNTSISNISNFGNTEEFNQRPSAFARPSFGGGEPKTDDEQRTNELNFEFGTFNNNAKKTDYQSKRRRFYKQAFRIKFEKIHNSHKGFLIDPCDLFAECQRLKIPEEKWEDFILCELTNPNKYFNALKKKSKFKKQTSHPTPMGVIKEEE